MCHGKNGLPEEFEMKPIMPTHQSLTASEKSSIKSGYNEVVVGALKEEFEIQPTSILVSQDYVRQEASLMDSQYNNIVIGTLCFGGACAGLVLLWGGTGLMNQMEPNHDEMISNTLYKFAAGSGIVGLGSCIGGGMLRALKRWCVPVHTRNDTRLDV